MTPRHSFWLGSLLALTTLSAPALAAAPTGAVGSIDSAIRQSLEISLSAFNAGDFEGYLHDFAPRITYNALPVDRPRLVDINKELRESFPNLKMKYDRIRVSPMGDNEASATTITEFTGSTNNYDNSGLSATYRESGQVTALYQHEGANWITHQLDVAWNDSFIDIGQVFGSMGFNTLPTLTGTGQPYRLRLYVGDDERQGFGVAYAYAIAPLKSVIDKAGAEQVFKQLEFKAVPRTGLDQELIAPKAAGTYAHVLVVNKYWHAGNNESIVGQKIYTRLVRIE